MLADEAHESEVALQEEARMLEAQLMSLGFSRDWLVEVADELGDDDTRGYVRRLKRAAADYLSLGADDVAQEHQAPPAVERGVPATG